ncbi:hypothetical protein KKF17_01060, partial [Patescibacteria group bacterium]|nr:hypothetical protein [Patescibacteria group bacterium]
FLPASQSEAPPPRALGAEAEAEKLSFPFRRKNRRAQIKKCEENFSARQAAVIGGGRRGGANGFIQEFLIK